MKTICHISSVHIAKDTRIYHKECKALAETGYKVKLLVMNAADTTSDYDNVEIISVSHTFKQKWMRVLRAPGIMLREAKKIKADVYHFHDPELLLIALQLKRTGAAVIYDAHEDVPKQVLTKDWIPLILRKVISWLVQVFENRVVRQIDAVITVVEGIELRLKAQGVKVVLVKNYPEIAGLPPLTDWYQKEKAVCYIGDLTRIRGIEELVASVQFFNASLILAGRWSQPGLENKVKSMLGWSKTVYLGFLSRKEVLSVFQRSKVGTIIFHPAPNHLDALPNKLFEYLAAGIPVVASDFGYLQEIISKYKCGLTVDPLNPEAIGNAIQYLLDHDDEAREMGERGRQAVLETFNWETERQKLVGLYADLLKR